MPTAVVSCVAFSFWIFDEETLIDGQDHISGGNSAPKLQVILCFGKFIFRVATQRPSCKDYYS